MIQDASEKSGAVTHVGHSFGHVKNKGILNDDDDDDDDDDDGDGDGDGDDDDMIYLFFLLFSCICCCIHVLYVFLCSIICSFIWFTLTMDLPAMFASSADGPGNL